MSRKFSVILVLCIVLFGAILAGYWDMLSSQRQNLDGDRTAEVAPETQTGETKDAETAAPEQAAPSETPANPPTEAAKPATPAPAAGDPAKTSTPPATETRTAANMPAGGPPGTPSETMSDAPRFDLLRVDPDGSAVIAGQAGADSEVRILSGGKQIGSAKASRAGDFALVLDERLTVGSHSIRIEAKGPDGRTTESREVAVVSVPRPDNPGELLAMIEQPGQASRIITAPKPEALAAPSTAASDTAQKPSPAAPAQQASVAPKDAASAAGAAGTAPQAFAVEAVEIENGTIYIAGRAGGREPVRVYVDEKLVGEDRVRANGRFLVTAQTPLAQGEHRIRADLLGSDGRVASRVEVPFTKPDSDTMSALASDQPGSAAPMSTPADQSQNSAAASDAQPAAPSSGATAPAPVGAATGQGSDVGTVVQPALQAVDTRVLIRRGDTLWRISRDTYGLGRRYTVIYLANGDQIRNPNRIYPGQLLRVPKHEDGTETR